ncbi:DNA topoisomerase IV [Paucihalobacter sp.]|uniref:DNA topoisomerase IV n=1 Tax=Paucihalobacter sp. TaxID=2850405 RepID=UPI002FE02250
MNKLLLLSSLIMFCSCYQIERDCKQFKTGTFTSTIRIDDVDYISTFKRNDLIQIETFEGKTDSSTVRWINDCEVIFKTINPKNRAERKDVHLKILITTDSSYVFEYSYVGEAKKQKGLAIKSK